MIHQAARSRHLLTALALLLSGLLSATSHAVTTNWTNNSGGSFTAAGNWDNGVPDANDTAVFRRGNVPQYDVSFFSPIPFPIGSAIHPTVNRLIVGTNPVNFYFPFLPSTLTVDQFFGLGGDTIIGQTASDVAVLNMNLASLSTLYATLASAAGSSGTLNLNGARMFNVTGTGAVYDLIVGASGTGAINVASGADVTVAGDTVLGQNASGVGNVSVSGAGSTWTNSGNLRVGGSGAGTLNLSSGGQLSNAVGYLGDSAGSNGSATINGNGSLWTNGSLYVGYLGNGTLNVTGGGDLVNNNLGYIGYGSGSMGSVTVSGAGSTWTNPTNLNVGVSGHGMLDINSGGQVSSSFVGIGFNAGSTGEASISGANSMWSNLTLVVGHNGDGTLNITGGGQASNFTGYVGNNIGSTGEASIDGIGSNWVNTGDLHVGNLGQGTLTIQNNGTVEVVDQLSINSLSTVNLSGGTLRVGSISGTENLNWAAGTLDITASDLRVESGGQFGDSLTIGPTQTLVASKVDGDHAVGEFSPGLMTVNGGVANFPNGGLKIGQQGKVLVTSGGHVSGGINLAPDGELIIDGAGSAASFGRHTTDVFGVTYSVVNGQITLTNGKVLTTTADIYEVSNGSITVDGPLTRWRHPGVNGFVSFAFAETVAELIVTDGGRASFPTLVVGEAGGTGTVRISGVGFHEALGPAPSTVHVGTDPFAAGPGDLHLGAQFEDTFGTSSGVIEIWDGGQLFVKRDTYMSSIDSTAAVTVDGAGSSWNNERDIFVGYSGNNNHGFGDATILISNGGTVVSDNGIVGYSGGTCPVGGCPLVHVAVDGSGSSWLMSDDLTVYNSTLTVSNGARVEAATVTMDSATELRGNGVIESFLVSTSGLVSPGTSVGALTIEGNYRHVNGAELFIELASASQYDQLIVENDIELFVGGTLSVALIDGFMPQAGNTFDILGFDELVGSFSAIDLPVLSGSLEWDTSQLYVSGVLAVLSNLPGDYNGNGNVDAGDYTVWRDNLGSSTSLPNEGASPGTVDELDYDFWKLHFGETIGSPGGGSADFGELSRVGASPSHAAVPEPATLVMFLLGMFTLLCRRRVVVS